MASVFRRYRSARVVAGVAVAGGLVVVAAIGSVTFVDNGKTDRHTQQKAIGPRVAAATVSVPELDVAGSFAAGSYHERAAYVSSGGVRRIFTARSARRPTWPCVGLTYGQSVSFSCAATLLPDGVMHVYRSIFGDEKFLAGIVAPAVTEVSFTENSGRTHTVEVKNRTFLFSGTSGQGRLEARTAAGTVLLEKFVEFSD
jgi:hypothetical protein